MNRIIKFRVWDNDNKKFISPANIEITGSSAGNLKWSLEPKGRDIIFQQFTGLTDKNGKEIYEGDILTNKWIVSWKEIEGLEQIIRFDIAPNCVGLIIPMDYKNREVIGNIYENSNLLK